MNGEQRRQAEAAITAEMQRRGLTGKDLPAHIKAAFAKAGIDIDKYDTIPDFQDEVHRRYG